MCSCFFLLVQVEKSLIWMDLCCIVFEVCCVLGLIWEEHQFDVCCLPIFVNHQKMSFIE